MTNSTIATAISVEVESRLPLSDDNDFFGHSVLSQDIHDADILDVIGYSGGDEHINAAVKYLGNDNLKVNIVDFCQNPDEYDPIREQTKIEEYGGLITSFSRVKEQVSLIPEGDDLYFDKAYNTKAQKSENGSEDT